MIEDIDKIIKRYKRFLKENGIYSKAVQIHCNGVKNRPKNVSFKTCLKECPHTSAFIQDAKTFCSWCSSPEGDVHWWYYSILWEHVCLKEGLGTFQKTMQQFYSEIECYINYRDGCFRRDLYDLTPLVEILKEIKNE